MNSEKFQQTYQEAGREVTITVEYNSFPGSVYNHLLHVEVNEPNNRLYWSYMHSDDTLEYGIVQARAIVKDHCERKDKVDDTIELTPLQRSLVRAGFKRLTKEDKRG